MIKFKQISTRNLLSYGNVPTVLQLDARKNTLVVGQNGSGKCVEKFSTIEIKFKDVETELLFKEFLCSK